MRPSDGQPVSDGVGSTLSGRLGHSCDTPRDTEAMPMGLNDTSGVRGVIDTHADEAASETPEMDPAEAIRYRALAARLNYSAAD